MLCSKCSSNFEGSDIKILGRCNHACCCKCLVDYLKNNLAPRIECIFNGCKRYISDRVVRECFTDDQIRIFEQLSILKSSETAVKCLTKQCQCLVIYEGENMVFECEFCGAPNCTRCKKRHYINDCGRDTADEEAIEARACDTLKKKQRKDYAELQKKHILIPNPESFECPICCGFFLPRVGVILRNCLHPFCKVCLLASIDAKENISTMTCSYDECGASLELGEIHELIKEDKLAKMMIEEAKSRFFQCKNGNCPGFWDVVDGKGSHVCDKCSKSNCLACQDIHEGMSCAEFRNTKRYQAAHAFEKIRNTIRSIECHLCKKNLIQDGGCAAMYCNCGSHTCLFTGKIAGRHDPLKCYCKGVSNCTKLEHYCGCTSKVPCHKECLYGCYPEDSKKDNK